MKHKTLVCLALAMMLIAVCASAQQLPSVNCFSPGLLKVNGLENSAVSIDAALTVENAMYARNLSVLQATSPRMSAVLFLPVTRSVRSLAGTPGT